MNLILDFPLWFLWLCPIVGITYALLLYFRDKSLKEISRLWQRIMAVFRFVVVTIIVFLLLGPFFRAENKQIIKPVIVVAQDNTQSLVIGKDSTYYNTQYRDELNNFITKVSEKYEVKTYTFGEGVKEGLVINYDEKLTMFNDLFKELYVRYANRNLGAIVLASDGLYNQGVSPETWTNKFKGIPIYSVALGDTTVRKDLLIRDVEQNRLAYLGNDFPVNVIVEGKKCTGNNAKVRILQNGVEIASKNFTIENAIYSNAFSFTIEAKNIGLQRYRIEVTELDGELTYANNYKDIFVEVLDSRQKVLLLANSPHPDINAIKTAIRSNKNYEVITKTIDKFQGNLQEYSLVILHQLPSTSNAATNVLDQIKRLKLPAIFILGSQSNINGFNALNLNLTINGYRNSLTPANGSFNRDFVMFGAHPDLQKELPRFPPLLIPFGDYVMSKGATPFIYQKIGTATTAYPLFYFNKETDHKTAVICGEGIWRWRINEYRVGQSTEVFDDLMQKTIQYMASKENRNFFRVFSKNDFKENENILFDAELYNESYELVNEATVNLVIRSAENKDKKYTFSRTTNAYRLDAGRFEVGDYNWEASVKYNDKTYTQSGQFSVSALNVELVNSVANHQLLLNMSNVTGGKLFYPGQWDKLLDEMLKSDDIVSTSRITKETLPIIDYKWLFFFIVLLLSAEWFLRKRMGSY